MSPFHTVWEPFLLDLGGCALEGIWPFTLLLLDVWWTLIEPILFILIWRRLLETILFEILGAGQLHMTLFLFHYFFILALLVLMGHILTIHALIGIFINIGMSNECLTELIMIHWIIWEHIRWLFSSNWGLFIYLILIKLTITRQLHQIVLLLVVLWRNAATINSIDQLLITGHSLHVIESSWGII